MTRGAILAAVFAAAALGSVSGWAAQPMGGAQPVAVAAVKPARAASAKPAARPGPIAAPSASDFQVANWFSVEAPGSHLIRHDAVGKALTEPATGVWEEITVFAKKKNKNRELAYERAHAADVGFEASNSALAEPTIKQPAAPTLFDFKF